MVRFRSQYVCQQCGYSQTGWAGKCPECETWGSLIETVLEQNPTSSSGKKIKADLSKIANLKDVKKTSTARSSTKIQELDRVLGGGLVPGQVVLIAGEPGIGKSTLLTQLSDKLSNVLYVCGEESAGQVAVRAERLGIKPRDMKLLEETDVDRVVASVSSLTDLKGIIVDSIQTMTTSDLNGMAGSVGQVRECTFRLLKVAKEAGIPLFLVGHVTKEGTVGGPAALIHIVDTVLWFEGDKSLTIRMLRAVKNRFGPTDEVGIFQMEEKGLASIEDAEKAFLDDNSNSKNKVPGSVITSLMQGARPILVEIQALVVPTKLAIPRRVAQGIDSRKLELMLAVLTRRCGLPLYEQDVFVNVAGGLKVSEPSSDLAICLAVASAFYDSPIPADTVAIGEVGLLGEIRGVSAQAKRLKEARRLGFSKNVTSVSAKTLSQALNTLKLKRSLYRSSGSK